MVCDPLLNSLRGSILLQRLSPAELVQQCAQRGSSAGTSFCDPGVDRLIEGFFVWVCCFCVNRLLAGSLRLLLDVRDD